MEDRADFAEFYEREFQGVYKTAWAFCRDSERARDATQEAFAKAFARWTRVSSHPHPVGWVVTTALNTLRRWHLPAPPTLAFREVESDRETAVDVWDAVRRLPRRQQEAVILYYVLDLPVDSVANLMNCRTGTVKSHLSRARFALRHAMELGSGSEQQDVRSSEPGG